MANKAPVWYLPGPFTRYNEDVKALAQKSGVRIVDARFVPEDGRKDAAPEKDPAEGDREGQESTS